MSFSPLKVTFHLDGTGVLFDPAEPIHLDALLVLAAAAHHGTQRGELTREERPDDIPLPVARWRVGSVWGWSASALFPDGQTAETLQFWRKKFRQNRVELTAGSPNLTNATWREYNMPMPLVLCHTMIAWCLGDRRNIRHELIRSVRHLGKKAAMGKGCVNDITVERVDEDWSLVRAGRAQRWLPSPSGARLCRARPPYWNNIERALMCEVGEPYDLENLTR